MAHRKGKLRLPSACTINFAWPFTASPYARSAYVCSTIWVTLLNCVSAFPFLMALRTVTDSWPVKTEDRLSSMYMAIIQLFAKLGKVIFAVTILFEIAYTTLFRATALQHSISVKAEYFFDYHGKHGSGNTVRLKERTNGERRRDERYQIACLAKTC